MTCAALIPVGPAAQDEARLIDLIDALAHYEPGASAYVLVDDGPDRPNGSPSLLPSPSPSPGVRDLEAAVRRIAPDAARVVVLRNPRGGRGNGAFGGLCAGLLHALRWIHEHLNVDWVLKADLDALAIAPFAASIDAFLARTPDAGIVGCIGETSDRADPQFRDCLRRRSRLVMASRLAEQMSSERLVDTSSFAQAMPNLARMLRDNREMLADFARVRPHVDLAVRNGLQGWEYCQGGAYVVSRELIRRLHAAGLFDTLTAWIEMPFGEDEVIGMYCRAVGLRLHDLSDAGQPFGIRIRDLPAAPADLVRRGHALIHSIKDGAHGTEPELRRWFAERRRAPHGCVPHDGRDALAARAGMESIAMGPS